MKNIKHGFPLILDVFINDYNFNYKYSQCLLYIIVKQKNILNSQLVEMILNTVIKEKVKL